MNKPFPHTLNEGIWKKYLNRDLIDEERCLISSLRSENEYNKDLEKLYEITKKKQLYIVKLTPRDGNCLFQSLNILGFCNDADNLRKTIAYLMYLYRDDKDFFKYDSRSLRQMFDDTNDVQYVLCKEETTVYKYTYETMCQDLSSGNTWTRLPTQLIMQFISKLLQVKFDIYSNNSEYVNQIGEETTKTIFLGHIDERHYVPLDQRRGRDYEDRCPKYNKIKKVFHEWAKAMELQINSTSKPKPKYKTRQLDEYTEISTLPQPDNLVEYE